MKLTAKMIVICIMVISLSAVSLYGYVWEGFEKENLWSVTVMKGNAVNDIKIVKSQQTEGKQSLEVDLGKTGSKYKGFLSREGSMDLSGIKEIQFDIYIEKPLQVSVGLSTGEDWGWYETKAFRLKEGWNKNIKMNLDKKEWKSAATGWELNDQPKNLKDTKKIAIVFMQGREGKVYIDNVRFTGKNIANPAYTMPYEPLDTTKLVDEYSLLEELSVAGWAKEKSPGVKKEGKLYSLQYSKVDNVGKAAYKVQMDMDWTDYSKLVMSIKNDSKQYCCISMGIQSGNGWKWYESPQYLLKPGKSTEVEVLLTASNFKTEDTDWKYVTNLFEKNNIKGIHFLIYGVYGSTSTGNILIESFKLMKGKPFSPQPPEEEEEE